MTGNVARRRLAGGAAVALAGVWWGFGWWPLVALTGGASVLVTIGPRFLHGRFRGRVLGLVGAAALFLVPGAVALAGMPRGASARQEAIHDLYLVALVGALALGVLTLGLLLWFSWRYRAGGKRAGPGGGTAASWRLGKRARTAWVTAFLVVPTVVIFGAGWYSYGILLAHDEVPVGATPIDVEAVQFAWRFTYTDRSETLNALYLVQGEPVVLRLTSSDVVHSIFIPQMGVKMDAMPGTVTEVGFVPEREGTYSSYCVEWCGIAHAEMYATVHVLPEGSPVPPPDAVVR